MQICRKAGGSARAKDRRSTRRDCAKQTRGREQSGGRVFGHPFSLSLSLWRSVHVVPCSLGKMPRRSRPWCTIVPGAAAVFLMIAGTSTSFVQIKHSRSRGSCSRSLSATSAARPTAESLGFHGRGPSAVGWWRRPRADETLRMVAQQETQLPELAAKLAASTAAGTAVAKPFVSRKLGSFEKMLTQTRDGVGPAEEGIRTLLTPHVWVSVRSPTSVSHRRRCRVEKSQCGGPRLLESCACSL